MDDRIDLDHLPAVLLDAAGCRPAHSRRARPGCGNVPRLPLGAGLRAGVAWAAGVTAGGLAGVGFEHPAARHSSRLTVRRKRSDFGNVTAMSRRMAWGERLNLSHKFSDSRGPKPAETVGDCHLSLRESSAALLPFRLRKWRFVPRVRHTNPKCERGKFPATPSLALRVGIGP